MKDNVLTRINDWIERHNTLMLAGCLLVLTISLIWMMIDTGKRVDEKSKDMTIPTTETLIQAMTAYNPGNDPMYRSTITFADMTNKLVASYKPYHPEEVRFEGTGISSTEVTYEFVVYLLWSYTEGRWKANYVEWNMKEQ